MLAKLNPNMNETATMIRPDGDVEIPEVRMYFYLYNTENTLKY